MPVKARVGEIRQYWAYEGGAPKFERGYEPETEWHASWKWPVLDQYCEVIFGTNNEHRADILGARNTVIEVQHSRIDIRDARDRVDFYAATTGRRVIWVVDVSDFWRRTLFLGERTGENYHVEWKPKRSWLFYLAQTRDTHLFLEYKYHADKLLLAWVHQGAMWAKFVLKTEFFGTYLQAVSKPEFNANPALFAEGFARLQPAG